MARYKVPVLALLPALILAAIGTSLLVYKVRARSPGRVGVDVVHDRRLLVTRAAFA